MRLPLFISFLFTQLFASIGFSQEDTIAYIRSPYRTEPSPLFQFSTLERGFHNDTLEAHLQVLDQKNKHRWTHIDSLDFAQATLRIGNISLSEYYFNRIQIDFETEEDFWWDHLMLHMLNNEHEEGLNLIRKESPGVLQYSKIYFIQRIFMAKVKQAEGPKNWYKNNCILGWQVDSTANYSSKDEAFHEYIMDPLENADFVLKFIIRYIPADDPIISRSFFEVGLILEEYVSLSQAYIAFSVARHYNRRDKEILENIKRIKALLLERMYKIPNFRKYFPRTESRRFDYAVLKEKILAQQDTTNLTKPKLLKKKEADPIQIPSNYIFTIGLAVMFFIILFFVRSKKK